MTDHLGLPAHHVLREDRADGTILLRSGIVLPKVVQNTSVWLKHWAENAPERVAFAERSSDGWREVCYADLWDHVARIAAALLDLGVHPQGSPILILSGNSIDHALLTLAAHHVGIVTVPVAEQYALIPDAHTRLHYVAALVQPVMVFADDGVAYRPAIERLGLPAICSRNLQSGDLSFDTLLAGGSADVDAAHARVGPDTLAKILLTSGSTSDPKGVETTQRMLTTNQAQIAACLPFVTAHPPVLVDWLPWNHVFGGSHNFYLVLANGGSLYIDDGKPLPALFPKTLANLGKVSGTISFNVPVGFAQLVKALEANADLREIYFRNLDMIFYAGASLPQDTWSALERLAQDTLGRLPLITSSWGLTETAPAALLQHQPAKGAGIVGVPMPGVTVKLVDDGSGRMDVRVGGDSIFKFYHKNPTKTAAAFDEEGFFMTGDAMRFVDPDDMSRGLRFDGRLSEDFKLATGTWVQAANLRLALLPHVAPFATDVVLVGDGRTTLGALIVPNRAVIEAQGWDVTQDAGAMLCADLRNALKAGLEAYNTTATGSAARVASVLVLSDPPDMGAGEITAKGNLNFARIIQRRADLVARVYDKDDPATLTL